FMIDYIINSANGDYERTVALRSVGDILRSDVVPSEYISQTYIIDNNENVYASDSVDSDALIREEWYQAYRDSFEAKAIIPTHDTAKYFSRGGSEDTKVISILRKFKSIDLGESLGIIGIDISYRYLTNLFLDSQLNQATMTLVTDYGEIVYDYDDVLVGNQIDLDMFSQVFENSSGSYNLSSNGLEYVVVYTTSPVTNWKLIHMIPANELFAEAQQIRNYIFMVGVLCVGLALVIASAVSYGISSPLTALKNGMRKVESGDLDVVMEVAFHDEVGVLSHSFNRMIDEISRYIKRIYEEEDIKKRIELNMLQQQINPHFLFNTLDSVIWMARMHNAPKVASIITSLVKLLQASTYTDSDFIQIHQEIENIKNYIAIQKFRYGSRFEFYYDIDENLKNIYTLKLILQPLVENAIYHGLEEIVEGGIISIKIKCDHDAVIMSVEDNGKGIDLNNIRQILNNDDKDEVHYNSIGISNTNQRIKMYYGDAYGLEMESIPSGGTRAIIRIPIRLKERTKLDDKSDDC
ncbi:MAG: sensor histidine kinase, partial [Vallitaleaceae bacterium]|nr:sensor histidine kinase [Vallitaleaceae bacterium]